jgi:hypothetical protein
MSWKLKLYEKSPVSLQNLLTTVAGYKIRRIRYTRHTWRTLDFLMQSQWWTKEQFEVHQTQQLKKLVKHAMYNSPYYRDLYASHGVSLDHIRCVEDIRQLPVVAKEEFRKHSDRFVCTNYDRRKCGSRKPAAPPALPSRPIIPIARSRNAGRLWSVCISGTSPDPFAAAPVLPAN